MVLLKVYTRTTIIELRATKGVSSLNTLKGKSVKNLRIKDVFFIKRSGYFMIREFYQMNYYNSEFKNQLDNIRPTLYKNLFIKITDGKFCILRR